MDLNAFKLIVLRTIRYKESGLIVKGYDQERGMVSLFLRSGAKSKRHNVAQLHPLAIVEGTTVGNSRSEMKNIKEFLPSHRLSSIRESVVKISIALYMCELILKNVREEEQNRPLFIFLESSIVQLEQLEEGVANFHLWFTVHFIALLGYLPSIPKERDNRLFDIISAQYIEAPEERSELFSKDESILLWKLYQLDITELEQIKINGEFRSKFLSRILDYLIYHSGQHFDCNSLTLLGQLFCG